MGSPRPVCLAVNLLGSETCSHRFVKSPEKKRTGDARELGSPDVRQCRRVSGIRDLVSEQAEKNTDLAVEFCIIAGYKPLLSIDTIHHTLIVQPERCRVRMKGIIVRRGSEKLLHPFAAEREPVHASLFRPKRYNVKFRREQLVEIRLDRGAGEGPGFGQGENRFRR